MKKLRIGFVSENLGSLGIQEAILKTGAQLISFVVGSLKVTDSSGLGMYKNYRSSNLGSVYKSYTRLEPLKADLEVFASGIDFAVFDYNGELMLEIADFLRSLGVSVVGPTAFTDALELNREYGKQFAAQLGLQSRQPGKFFDSAKAAISYVKKVGNCLLKGKDHTIFPVNDVDCIDFIEQDSFGFFKAGGVYLEKQIVGGQEYSYDFWFDGESLYPYCFVNREYKGYHNNGRGQVMSGESGTCGTFISLRELPQSLRECFETLELCLAKHEYRGFFGINTIELDGELNFLEFTTRMGYPTELIMTTAVENYAFFLSRLAGKHSSTANFQSQTLPIAHIHTDSGYRTLSPYDLEDRRVAYTAVALLWFPHFVPETRKDGWIYPEIHGVNQVREHKPNSYISVVLQNASYIGKNRIRINDHDRALVVVSASSYKHEDSLEESEYRLRTLYEEVRKVKCFSHSYRDDIGVDLPIVEWFESCKRQSQGSQLVNPKTSKGLTLLTPELATEISVLNHYSLASMEYTLEPSDLMQTTKAKIGTVHTLGARVATVRHSDGSLLSSIVCHFYPAPDNPIRLAIIEVVDVTTNPMFTGVGLAQSLLRRVLAYAKRESKQGELHVKLECDCDLKGFYSKAGFKVRKELKDNRLSMSIQFLNGHIF